MLTAAPCPAVLATATWARAPPSAAALLHARRDGEPFFCAEFWNGWFDHWGEKHHVRAVAGRRRRPRRDPRRGRLGQRLHGPRRHQLRSSPRAPTTTARRYQPTVTSYDYDAPVAETRRAAGEVLRHARPAARADRRGRAPAARRRAAARAALPGAGPRRGAARRPRRRVGPGGVAAPAHLRGAAPGVGAGALPGAPAAAPRHARAGGGRPARPRPGLRRRRPAGRPGPRERVAGRRGGGRAARLDLLVENQGRINYGPLLGQGKGILGSVRIDRRLVQGWRMHPLPLDEWTPDALRRAAVAAAPAGGSGFATAQFTAEEAADTFLAFPGFAKGFAWINGELLGRYWEIGPQVTLVCARAAGRPRRQRRDRPRTRAFRRPRGTARPAGAGADGGVRGDVLLTPCRGRYFSARLGCTRLGSPGIFGWSGG